MRPMKLALALAAVAALLPAASLAQATCESDGGFLFVDKKNFEFNTTCSDAEGLTYCLSGRANPIDGSSTPNRIVQVDWFSEGSVAKSSASATKGDFSTVTLTLTIFAIRSPADGNNCTLWQSVPASFPCKLKGGTKKSNTQSRVKLFCELGEDLSSLVPAAGFGPLTDDLLESVESAFLRRKNMKVDVKKGKLKIIQRGEDAPPNFENFLMCPAVVPVPSGGTC
jgi:hypothetical protein